MHFRTGLTWKVGIFNMTLVHISMHRTKLEIHEPGELKCIWHWFNIKICHLISIGNPIVEIRWSSTMGLLILVRWHFYIESVPWYLNGSHQSCEHVLEFGIPIGLFCFVFYNFGISIMGPNFSLGRHTGPYPFPGDDPPPSPVLYQQPN